MAEEKLTKREIDDVLGILELGPLMSERAKSAVSHLDPDAVRSIGQALAEARHRSADLRDRAESVKDRLEKSGATKLNVDQPRIKTLQDARNRLTQMSTLLAESSVPSQLAAPYSHIFSSASLWLLGGHIEVLEQVRVRFADLPKQKEDKPDISVDEASLVLTSIEDDMVIDA